MKILEKNQKGGCFYSTEYGQNQPKLAPNNAENKSERNERRGGTFETINRTVG